jgi:hypothetical protein
MDIINNNKNKVYNYLSDNTIKYTLNSLNKGQNDIFKLLSAIAHKRYNIEYVLSKLFPQLELDSNLDKFGRCRSNKGNHGRNFVFRKIDYSPFNFLVENDHIECLITPIYKKYSHYDDIIKHKCVYYNSYITNEPIHQLLYKYDVRGYTTIYNNLELTTFYYELNNLLYAELDLIPMNKRYLNTDINLYRAIYHTNPKNHILILNEVNIELQNVLNISLNKIDRISSIIKIYWWLSHATLYERGSCAITEILCNSLLVYVNNNNITFISESGINLDIEAMLTPDPYLFIDNFNKNIKFRKMDLKKYETIDIRNYDNIIVKQELYTQDLNNIFNIDDLYISETNTFKSIIKEFDN